MVARLIVAVALVAVFATLMLVTNVKLELVVVKLSAVIGKLASVTVNGTVTGLLACTVIFVSTPKTGVDGWMTVSLKLVEAFVSASLAVIVTLAVPSALLTKFIVAITLVPAAAKLILATRFELSLVPLNVRLVAAVTGSVTGRVTATTTLAELVLSGITPNTGGKAPVTVILNILVTVALESAAVTVTKTWPVIPLGLKARDWAVPLEVSLRVPRFELVVVAVTTRLLAAVSASLAVN